jgi:aminoglycoside phosphotransferase (APT) family kinase protein
MEPLGQGNINDTWLLVLEDGQHRVLQRLSPEVFPDPLPVMRNLRLLAAHLAAAPGPEVPVSFSLLTTADGKDQHLDKDGCWRMLSYIEGSRTLAHPLSPIQAREIGRLLGQFHRLTAALAPDLLADPLPGFHITPLYLARFDGLVPRPAARNDLEQACFTAIEAGRELAVMLETARPRLRHQVIHGDPKLTNVLFSEQEDRALSLIDLDTVKPGLLLHDLGDCLRSCCSQQGEEVPDLATVTFDADLFEALLAGYWPQAGHLLGQDDRDLLVTATRLICFELGLRFFTDHLEGDRYFRVSRPGHNLHRATIQFNLARDVLAHEQDLQGRLLRLIRDERPCNSSSGGL